MNGDTSKEEVTSYINRSRVSSRCVFIANSCEQVYCLTWTKAFLVSLSPQSALQGRGAGGVAGHPGDRAAPGQDPAEPPGEGEPGDGAAEAATGGGRARAGEAKEEEGGAAPYP